MSLQRNKIFGYEWKDGRHREKIKEERKKVINTIHDMMTNEKRQE